MLHQKNRFTKLLRYLSTFCFVTASGSTSALPPVSKVSPSDKNIESEKSNHLVEYANEKLSIQRFDITSGYLTTKPSSSWKYGWSNDNAFRVIASQKDNRQQDIKYTNQTNQYRAQIKGWKNTNAIIPEWSGLHAITRYQTADDLYVASIRYDGNVTIKVKYQGNYATLAQKKLTNGVKKYLDENGHLATEQWYKINFSAVGEQLTLSLDGIELLSVHNELLAEGTIGIRTDHVETYLDDWLLVEGESAIHNPVIMGKNKFLLSKTKVHDDNDLFNHGQCLQAQNNKGVWETSNESPWLLDCVEHQKQTSIFPIKLTSTGAPNRAVVGDEKPKEQSV